MSDPIEGIVQGFQDLVGLVPEPIQPLVVALAGAVPFIEGQGSAMLGVLGGMHPIVAAVAGAIGNMLAVTLVVLLGARIRERAVARQERRRARAAATTSEPALAMAGVGGDATASSGGAASASATDEAASTAKPESKGRQRLRRWLVRFGVPGASLLAPLALPTHLTAATFVASGVAKGWVLVWQAAAIVLWTTLLTLAATGVVAVVDA